MKSGMTCLMLLLLAAGCSRPQPYVNPIRMERGLVIVLPGIEGPSRLNREVCNGLAEGGVDLAIETYDWTSFLGPLWNLRATSRNHRQARYLADRIVRYQAAYPGKSVFLVGQSGGGAIAVWAAELLPREHKVDGIILLSASLSPYYMLDEAIANSRQGIVSFYSNRDWFLLATNVTGTMDGELSSSAGRTGFLHPEDAPSPRSYARLFQVPWDQQMARAGNTGGHLTSGAHLFIAKYVAPLLTLKAWDEESIGAVMANGNGTHAPASTPAGRDDGAATRPATRPAPRPASRPGEVPMSGSPSRRR